MVTQAAPPSARPSERRSAQAVAPAVRAGPGRSAVRAARCAVKARIPRLATATTAVPIVESMLSQRVCRTTATTNAPANCRISRRRRVAAAVPTGPAAPRPSRGGRAGTAGAGRTASSRPARPWRAAVPAPRRAGRRRPAAARRRVPGRGCPGLGIGSCPPPAPPDHFASRTPTRCSAFRPRDRRPSRRSKIEPTDRDRVRKHPERPSRQERRRATIGRVRSFRRGNARAGAVVPVAVLLVALTSCAGPSAPAPSAPAAPVPPAVAAMLAGWSSPCPYPAPRGRADRRARDPVAALAHRRQQRPPGVLGAGERRDDEELRARPHRAGPAGELHRRHRPADPDRVRRRRAGADRGPRGDHRPDPRSRRHQLGAVRDDVLRRRRGEGRRQAGAVGRRPHRLPLLPDVPLGAPFESRSRTPATGT